MVSGALAGLAGGALVLAQARAEEELSHTREALFQSEHLSILGELASSIAHEMGNTLRAVTTRATVLFQDPSVMAATVAAPLERKLGQIAGVDQIMPSDEVG